MERPLRCPLCASPCSLLLLLTELHWRYGLTLHFVHCSLPLLTIFTLLLLWCHFSFYRFMTFLLSSCQCFFPFCLPCPSPAESDLSETGRCAHLLPASGSHVWTSYTGKKPAWTDEASWGSLCFLPESVVSYLWGCTHFLFAFSTHVWENGTGKVLVSVEIIFFSTPKKKPYKMNKILNNQRCPVALKKLVPQKCHVHNTRAPSLDPVHCHESRAIPGQLPKLFSLRWCLWAWETALCPWAETATCTVLGAAFQSTLGWGIKGAEGSFCAIFYIS